MATPTASAAIEDARSKIKEGRDRLKTIRAGVDLAAPKLEETATELQSALDSAFAAIDTIAADSGAWATTKRTIRRLMSREFLIAVGSIFVIVNGGLVGQEALAVALAGSGLALGRGVAKARSGGADS